MKAEFVSSSVAKPRFLNSLSKALVAGIGGYFLFLGILFLTKLISVIVQSETSISHEPTDFILPLIGFFLLFLIKILENFKEA